MHHPQKSTNSLYYRSLAHGNLANAASDRAVAKQQDPFVFAPCGLHLCNPIFPYPPPWLAQGCGIRFPDASPQTPSDLYYVGKRWLGLISIVSHLLAVPHIQDAWGRTWKQICSPRELEEPRGYGAPMFIKMSFIQWVGNIQTSPIPNTLSSFSIQVDNTHSETPSFILNYVRLIFNVCSKLGRRLQLRCCQPCSIA
jgi:hypothetical protein